MRELAGRFALLLVSAYGLFYFSYKNLNPVLFLGDTDYYYGIYRSPLNFHAGLSPFVLRQVGAVLTWLAWKSHLYYPASIAYVDPAYDQRIFFASLLVNWLCLVFAALVSGLLAEEWLGQRNSLMALVAAFLCLLSFQSQAAVITDLAEGPAWLLLGLAFLAYARGAWVWMGGLLVLSTFQREMILLAVGFTAFLELYPTSGRRRFASFTLAGSMCCFLFYVALRRHLSGWSFQTSPGSLLLGLVRWHADRDLLFQGFLSQNTLLIALTAFAVQARQSPVLRYWMPKVLAVFLFLALVSLGSYEGNNTGRLTAILTPVFAACAAIALSAKWMQAEHRKTPADARYRAGTNRVAMAAIGVFVFLLVAAPVYQRGHPRAPKHHKPLPVELPSG